MPKISAGPTGGATNAAEPGYFEQIESAPTTAPGEGVPTFADVEDDIAAAQDERRDETKATEGDKIPAKGDALKPETRPAASAPASPAPMPTKTAK